MFSATLHDKFYVCVRTKGWQWVLLKMTAVTHEPKDKCIFSNQVMTICKLSKHAKIQMFSTDVENEWEFWLTQRATNLWWNPMGINPFELFGVSAFMDSTLSTDAWHILKIILLENQQSLQLQFYYSCQVLFPLAMHLRVLYPKAFTTILLRRTSSDPPLLSSA